MIRELWGPPENITRHIELFEKLNAGKNATANEQIPTHLNDSKYHSNDIRAMFT